MRFTEDSIGFEYSESACQGPSRGVRMLCSFECVSIVSGTEYCLPSSEIQSSACPEEYTASLHESILLSALTVPQVLELHRLVVHTPPNLYCSVGAILSVGLCRSASTEHWRLY